LLATVDAQGCCRIVGRVQDMLIRGGENIYRVEIEDFLLTRPDVAVVQVFGVPDEKYGEEVCAWVVPPPAGAGPKRRCRSDVGLGGNGEKQPRRGLAASPAGSNWPASWTRRKSTGNAKCGVPTPLASALLVTDAIQ